MSRTRIFVRIGLVLAAISIALTTVLIMLIATTHFRGVQVDPGQTIRGDLVTTSARVEILGTVRGDVDARALYMRQVGAVSGDLTIVAGRAELRGPIAGSVRIYGGSISLYGAVEGNVEVFGGQVTVVEASLIHGDLIVHGGVLTVVANARVDGDLRGKAARVTIEGSIGGDVDLTVWRLSLAPGASVEGAIRYESRDTASIADSSSVVSNSVERMNPADRFPFGRLLFWHAGALPRYLAMVILGIALVLAAPGQIGRVADTIRRQFALTLFNGVAIMVFAPILLATIGLFVVTLPLVLAGSALLAIAAYLSQAVVGVAVGRALLRRPVSGQARGAELVAAFMGITGISAVRVVPLPYIDIGMALVTALIGLGAMLASVGRASPHRTARATHPAASYLAGVLAGSLIVVLAVLAIGAAVTGTLAAVATLSRSAQFTWEVAPRRLAATALGLATVSLILGAAALYARRHGKSRIDLD